MTKEFSVLTAIKDRQPVTASLLTADLARLGVGPGDNLLVHSSLTALGWVVGGAESVVQTLLDLLGPSGTLMMPAHSGQLTDPSSWKAPPVPASWWPVIRAETPAFNPMTTPTRLMGVIADTFRAFPDVGRSGHPYGSFAAHGPATDFLLQDHRPGCAFGEHSPLGRWYELDGKVLLMGVDHGNNTSLHLAEYRAEFPGKRYHREGSPMLLEGRREWLVYRELVHDDADFQELGRDFARATHSETRGRLGWGEGRLMQQRDVVNYAVQWLPRHRSEEPHS